MKVKRYFLAVSINRTWEYSPRDIRQTFYRLRPLWRMNGMNNNSLKVLCRILLYEITSRNNIITCYSKNKLSLLVRYNHVTGI